MTELGRIIVVVLFVDVVVDVVAGGGGGGGGGGSGGGGGGGEGGGGAAEHGGGDRAQWRIQQGGLNRRAPPLNFDRICLFLYHSYQDCPIDLNI